MKEKAGCLGPASQSHQDEAQEKMPTFQEGQKVSPTGLGAPSGNLEDFFPDRLGSFVEPSSHGVALGAELSSEAEVARLHFRDGELVSLIHQVLDLLPLLPMDIHRHAVQDVAMDGVFPLPLPRVRLGYGCKTVEAWEEGVIRGINWLVCSHFRLSEGPPSAKQDVLLDGIQKGLVLLEQWKGLDTTSFDPKDLFKQKWVNSYGVEVHVAQKVRWENISESLPKEGVAGIVPACDVCEDGFRDFLLHPHRWLKAKEDRVWIKSPMYDPRR